VVAVFLHSLKREGVLGVGRKADVKVGF
jgi:hypothetical protein